MCGRCSDNRAPLRYLKYKVDRVCEACYIFLRKELESENCSQAQECVIELETGMTPSGLKARFQKIRRSFGKGLKHKRPAVLQEVRANDQGSSMSGYLRLMRNKKWKRLWFVIKDQVLYTYKASEDMAAVESVPLLGYEVQIMGAWYEGVEPGLVFTLTHKNTTPHLFRTESAASTEKWVTLLREATVPT